MSAYHHQTDDAFRRRLDAVRDRVDIVAVIERVVKLGHGAKPRGKCPFHGSKSDSFAVEPDRWRARCWGCQWSGDAIKFVQDHFGLSFMDALEKLESENGLDGLAPAPVRRDKRPAVRRAREVVPSAEFGRVMWNRGVSAPDKLRMYLRSRGVPESQLGDDRLRNLRFVALGPIAAWQVGGRTEDVPQAPAMVAMVRRPTSWAPIGAHITFLKPNLDGKMVRERRDGSEYPARKMAGESAGGCVVLGRYSPDAPLFVGEGIETVLSGMAEANASPDACGIAVLSLDNLQGHPRLIKGALPLYAPVPDAERGAAVCWAHRGPVTGLIDADMKPLPGPLAVPGKPEQGHRGVAVIEARRSPMVRRTITTAERTDLCAALFIAAWRAQGCAVGAIRPRMGRDFNDQVRETV